MLVTDRVARYTSLAGKLKRNNVSVLTRENAVRIAIVAVILLGGILRFSGRNWVEELHLHPDERFITMVATDIRWPSSIGEYFNSEESPLNPYNAKNDDDTNKYGSFIYASSPSSLGKRWQTSPATTTTATFHLPAEDSPQPSTSSPSSSFF